MNLDSKENLWLVDQLSRCRSCFRKFHRSQKPILITEIIKEQFLELTQIELKSSPSYSNTVCKKCVNELQTISSFRSILITKQQQLYEFVSTTEYTIKDVIKFEPVDIKIETQSCDEFVNTFIFETQYEEIENPEIPVIPKATKTKKKSSSSFTDQLAKSKSLRTLKTSNPKIKTKAETSVKKHQDERKRACPQCGIIMSKNQVPRHIRRVHLKLKRFFCDLCNYGVFNKFALQSHMKTHLRKTFVEKIIPKKKNKPMCAYCGRIMSCSDQLLRHIRRVHLKLKRFFCDLCNYGVFNKIGLKNHMAIHLPKTLREKFSCDQCNYVSISKVTLKRHKKFDHGTEIKKFVCHCGRVFKRPEILNQHKKYTHLKERNHICTVCNKGHSAPFLLKRHMETHKKNRKAEVACEICGKMFFTLRTLKIHMAYHKDPKFICDFEGCTKKFYKNTAFKDHKKTHIDQRDFACELCDKKYFLLNHLRRHVKNFHKQLKISCELPGCSSKFARKETYRNHLMSHHKDLSEEKVQLLFKKIREMKQE